MTLHPATRPTLNRSRTIPERTIVAAESDLVRHREARTRFVTSPQGPLALVNTQWISRNNGMAGETVWGVPGEWAPLPVGESGLRLLASAGDGIVVDGEPVYGSVVVRGRDSDSPSEIRFRDGVTGYVIAGESGDYALRVWDASSEAMSTFGSIDAYPFDPEWVIRASFTPVPGGRAVGFEHMQESGMSRQHVVPADITFSRDGIDYSVAAYWDEERLLLVFADATNGTDTYGVGRFLKVLPEGDGTVVLDFNRAYLPPCAFSYHFTCPMPPRENRFPVRIEAGERNVLDRADRLLH
ncbi:DUF1684 domain-containing protein [Planctomonas psychrotolerans]|uniref:DUF1684 domain-containing protein n=1 Tax=Planctomonas psychrotolerans TaxID=2528712 RepID=UPI0012395BC1|nr:DUF1684 domain-containing protein [Planctomonas psychrotolerans]